VTPAPTVAGPEVLLNRSTPTLALMLVPPVKVEDPWISSVPEFTLVIVRAAPPSLSEAKRSVPRPVPLLATSNVGFPESVAAPRPKLYGALTPVLPPVIKSVLVPIESGPLTAPDGAPVTSIVESAVTATPLVKARANDPVVSTIWMPFRPTLPVSPCSMYVKVDPLTPWNNK
jgi:hypothetical protein